MQISKLIHFWAFCLLIIVGSILAHEFNGPHRQEEVIRKKVKRAATKFNLAAERPVKQTALLEKDNQNGDSDESCENNASGLANFWTNLVNKARRLSGVGGPGSRRRIAGELDSSENSSEENTNWPDDRSPFRRLISVFKPWWEGPNVCKKEEEKTTPLSNLEQESAEFFTFYKSSCQDTGKSYRCTLKTTRNNSNVVRTLIYECCFGYGRLEGKSGCTKKLDLKPLEDTLTSLNLTRFLEVVRDTGLLKKLEEGNYTIFAPSNQAFEKPVDSDYISFVVSGTNDKMKYVRDVMAAHVVPDWHDLDSMEDEKTLNALKTGYSITAAFYSFPKPFITANCAKITNFDNQALNGLVHVIDRVMPQASRTLLQMLQDEPRFSHFLSLMDENTKKLLNSSEKHSTVFAFTDESFEKLPQKVQERIKNKADCVSDIVKQHIAPYTICSNAIYGRALIKTLNNQDLMLNSTQTLGDDQVSAHDLYVKGRRVISHDRVATNGVVQIIDGVILYPKNEGLLEALDKMGYSDLSKELANMGLQEQLDKGDNLSLLIPIRKDLMNITSTTDVELKRRLLLNHLVKNPLTGGPYRGDQLVETEAGSKYHLTTTPSHFSPFTPPKRTIGCARMSGQISSTCNGAIRFIDRTLPLQDQDLMSVLRGHTELDEFIMLIEASGFDQDFKTLPRKTALSTRIPSSEEIDGQSDVSDSDAGYLYRTIFAPNNRALKRYLSPDSKRKLLANKEELKRFIKRHIVDGHVCCHQLEGSLFFNNNRFTTEAGTALNAAGSERVSLQVDDSQVLECNLEARNGLVHVIDRPFLPRANYLSSLFDNWSLRSFFDE